MTSEERADRPPPTAGPPRPRAAPSMADVAALAGVSSQTVSRVSTGSAHVRPETREAVLAAMRQVGYAPNAAARALKYGSFHAIGVIAHRLARTGESRTVEAVVEAARLEGYAVSLVDLVEPSGSEMADAVQRLNHQSVDGLVIIRAETASPDDLVLPVGVPVVVSDSRFAGRHPGVATDQASGTRQAVEHLLTLGHRTVHHLAGPEGSSPARLRADTWRDTLRGAGREVPQHVVGDWSAQSGYELGKTLATDPAVTAVFCANDQMALGLVRALFEAGRSVPGDISVVGFDDIPESEFFWPPLTTVAQDFHLIGEKLVDVLFRQIRGDDIPSSRTLIPVNLVVRASTAPPPPGS